MAKKISLELQIGGVKKSVSSINELEQAISEANKELKGLEIGSDAFNKLSGQIKKAKDTAEDLNESLKGQDVEKRVGAYAKVGSAIVSSFGAAQAAIALFGEENEEVAKAAAKAQSVLTIALTAREVAEGLVAVKTVAANIATYASAAAANAATVATRALWATLAANPIGAILAVVGALITAFIALSDSTEKQVDVQKELASATSAEADALKNSLFILTQMNGQRNLQNAEIEKLKKAYPGLNAFIDKENKLNAEGIKFLKLKIKQYELEAQAKLITQKLAENGVKILQIEASSIFDNVTWYQKAINSLKEVGSIGGSIRADFEDGLRNQQKKIQEITDENERWRQSLVKVYQETDVVIGDLKTYETTMTNQVKIDEKAAKTKQELADQQKNVKQAFEKGLTSTIDLSNAMKELNNSLLRYNQTLENLSKISYEAPILEQLKKIKEARQTAAGELVSDIQRVQKTISEFKPGGVGVDPLINVFKVLREKLEQEFAKIGTAQFKGFQEIYKTFVTDNITLNQEQKNILTDIVQGYEDLSKLLSETPGFVEYVKSLKGINVEWDNFRIKQESGTDSIYNGAQALVAIIGEITAANKQWFLEFKQEAPGLGQILNQISDDVNQIEPIKFDPIKAKSNAQQYVKDLETALFKPVAVKLLQLELQAQQAALKTVTDPVRKGEIEGYIKNITAQISIVQKTGQLAANLTQTTGKQVQEEVKLISDGFLKLAGAVVTAEQKIFLVNQEFNKLKESLKPEELSQAIGGTVLANIEFISTLLLGARTKEQKIEKDFIEKIKADRKGLEDFKLQLIQAGVDVEKASYEDLLRAYIEYKKKEKEVDEKSKKDKKTNFDQNLSDISKGIQTFQQYLGETASLVNLRIQTDIESLRVAEKQALENVVGDTESAAEKRLEIQTEYEARRKELEKKARVSALQFSLVQAVANAALGITKTIAEFGFPIAAPLIAIQAGLTAAEIAIIMDQISNAQGMRRGGLIKAQGGMLLSGPTHEQGGIPLAQMGVIAEGQEAIINRNSLINYRDLLSTVNQAGGGRPLVVNNFDDTRIIEAIASQRQKPLRAYVLESEITNEQALSKRLDQLSKI